MGFPGKNTFNLEREREVLSTLSYDKIKPESSDEWRLFKSDYPLEDILLVSIP